MKSILNQAALKLSTLAAALAVGLASGSAIAESTYGYASSGAGTVTAIARVGLTVTVPKMILLRVGSAGNVQDPLAWTVSGSIPGVPTAGVNGNNQAVNWDGTAASLTTSANPAAVGVFAWTNASTASVACSMGAWSAAGGPTNANFTVASGAGLAHPGANLGACGATSAITPNTLATGSWTYSLGGTPGTWAAGTYTNTITYTATGI